MKFRLLLLVFSFISVQTLAYWQQRAEYIMQIEMNTDVHQFTGKQKLTYFNNSPDTIKRVFYHLYFNAFQPGSMMDIRSKTIVDPDARIGNRIANLDENQIGYQKINSLRHRGEAVKFKITGTVLEVSLIQSINPGEKTVFEMDFEAQVPLQIRRCGRQNNEGVDYSMAQWYPKMAEYDEMGWHPDPYVFREFYGIWGDFDVTITIDSSYVIGGTGTLTNPTEIGHGYCLKEEVERNGDDRLTWHFVAKNVHDFVWAADPDYKHITYQVPDGPMLHFFYQPQDTLTKYWKEFPPMAAKGFQYLSKHFGKYPFEQYSVIQGGDGGMEYPMATLITGRRKLGSLFGVTMHEAAHSWYQMILGSNESKYPWMDEGFTNYAGNEAFQAVMFPNGEGDPHNGSFISYSNIVKRGLEEPMSTHADHFKTNYAYGTSSYSKGELFLVQLRYIVGEECFKRSMLRYFRDWAFKHPDPYNFIRIFERESGMILDWYLEYWVFTTKTIDYEIAEVDDNFSGTKITIKRNGSMIMPVEVILKMKSGEEAIHYIPLGLQHGSKDGELVKHEPWSWVVPEYTLEIEIPKKEIETVRLNFERNVADINPGNDWMESSGPFNKFKR